MSQGVQKIQVLIVCPSFSSRGGISNYYQLFSKRYDQNRFHIRFFITGSRNLYISMSFFRQIQGLWFLAWDLIRLIFVLVTSRVDIVHLNPSMEWKSLLRDGSYSLICKFFEKKIIVHFRGWLKETESWVALHAKGLFCFVFGKTTRTVALGNSIKHLLVSWGWPEEKIVVSSTMFDEDRILEAKGHRGDEVQVLFLGIFLKEKGIFEVIESFRLIRKDYPAVKLIMAGDGPLFKEVRQRLDDYGLSGHVSLPGFLQEDEKYEIMATCDIFLFPTYNEGSPNSVLEAMGAGLAIVSRPVGGIPDAVEEGINGFLLSSFDPYDFAQVIKRLLKDPEKLKSIQSENRSTALKKYASRVVVRNIQDVYDNVWATSCN